MERTATRRIEASDFPKVGLVLDCRSHEALVYCFSQSQAEPSIGYMCLVGAVEEIDVTYASLGKTLQRY